MNAGKVTLLIKSNTILTKETYERLYKMFVDQLGHGVVFVPPSFNIEISNAHDSGNVEIILTQTDDRYPF